MILKIYDENDTNKTTFFEGTIIRKLQKIPSIYPCNYIVKKSECPNRDIFLISNTNRDVSVVITNCIYKILSAEGFEL